MVLLAIGFDQRHTGWVRKVKAPYEHVIRFEDFELDVWHWIGGRSNDPSEEIFEIAGRDSGPSEAFLYEWPDSAHARATWPSHPCDNAVNVPRCEQAFAESSVQAPLNEPRWR